MMDLTTLHRWYYSFIKLFFEEEALKRNISLAELIGTVQNPLKQLQVSYQNENILIDYSNPHIRLAYLYYYAPAYAVMTRILWKAYEIGSHSLETLERQGNTRLASLELNYIEAIEEGLDILLKSRLIEAPLRLISKIIYKKSVTAATRLILEQKG